jgi:hypothetical protein
MECGLKRRVAISGLGLFCEPIASELERSGSEWKPSILFTNSRAEVFAALFKLMRADVWYTIGSPISDRWLELAARILRKPRVMHWVGSDIETVRRSPRFRPRFTEMRVLHLSEVEWTARELRSYGIDSHIAPIPPRKMGRICPLPETFTILLYVPRTRASFYGCREYVDLMRHFAGKPVRFVIVGGGKVDIPPGVDATNLQWCDDLDPVYQDATVLVRFTQRDGLSLMVLEALAYGRYVIWSQPFEFSTAAQSYEDIRTELERLLERHLRGELPVRDDAAEAVQRRYDVRRCVGNIAQALTIALGRPRADSGRVQVQESVETA